ncbi:hypothetical protein BDZ94DRAFT_451888 [Collybia nuda]|uniref:Integral membrane protein n=1 Tax=Collybia nuda TaxID=64659 RepID=A0A9P5YA18_9AGAR|nr:hypothetical protein BDZ94DRAFT_451888 [Collybia nuda]
MLRNTPPWPSLYNPGLEILHIDHRNATQADIFRFTLFWTLLFYTPIFLVCGSYAFWNLNFPPAPRSYHAVGHTTRDTSYPLSPVQSGAPPRLLKPHKEKERRSRLAFALLVLLTFLILSVAGAVVGSAVLGFTVTGLYKAANFNMSTWIPFLLAVIQVLVGLLSIWPSIIDII